MDNLGLGRKAVALKADVTQKAEVDEMIKQATAEFSRIDILVNNVGIASPTQPFLDSNEDNWDQEMKVNYKGTLLCTKAILPQMIERKSGRIINISSPGATHGNDPAPTYTAAKAAVLGFSKSLASEYGPSGTAALVPSQSAGEFRNSGVNINVIATVQSEDDKSTSPEDVGKVAVFLASEGARRISGEVIVD